MLQEDNQTLIGPVDQSNWISAGLRLPKYALDTLAAIPAWGAPGEDHVVRSTGLVTSAAFTASTVRYETYDPRSTEWLQLGACDPTAVTAGGVRLQRVDPAGGRGEAAAGAGWWSFQAPGGHGDLVVFKRAATAVVVTCGKA